MDGGKSGRVSMGNELGGRKAVHKILVDVEFQIGNAISQSFHLFGQTAARKGQGSPAQRTVAK